MPIDPVDVLKLIQAAIAPVVLISGVGLLLLTLTPRLGRIVDRTRLVAAQWAAAAPQDRPAIETELEILRRRARLVRLAVGLSALCVGVIALLITVLFVGLLMGWNVGHACAFLFIAAMFTLVAAMMVFLRELFDSLAALDVTIQVPRR